MKQPIFIRSFSLLICLFLVAVSLSACSLGSDTTDSGGGAIIPPEYRLGILPSEESLGLSEKTLKNFHYHALSDADEKLLYIAILQSWTNRESSMMLEAIDYNAFASRVGRVVTAVYLDHPECFSYANGYQLKGSLYPDENDDHVTIEWKSVVFLQDAAEEEATLEAAILEILSSVQNESDSFTQVKIIHDALVNSVTYDHSAVNASGDLPIVRNSPYAALIQNAAICGGYARAFQLLLNRIGIPATTVTGMSRNNPHAWSIVTLGGENYLFDVTWDDASEMLSYGYFAVTSEDMEKSHKADEMFPYPECTATAMNYFVKEGLLVETYSLEEAKRMTALCAEFSAVTMKFKSSTEFQRAIHGLIENHEWSSLPGFEAASELQYAKDGNNLILTLYFPKSP